MILAILQPEILAVPPSLLATLRPSITFGALISGGPLLFWHKTCLLFFFVVEVELRTFWPNRTRHARSDQPWCTLQTSSCDGCTSTISFAIGWTFKACRIIRTTCSKFSSSGTTALTAVTISKFHLTTAGKVGPAFQQKSRAVHTNINRIMQHIVITRHSITSINNKMGIIHQDHRRRHRDIIL